MPLPLLALLRHPAAAPGQLPAGRARAAACEGPGRLEGPWWGDQALLEGVWQAQVGCAEPTPAVGWVGGATVPLLHPGFLLLPL